MKNPTNLKKIKGKRKRNNKEKSIFSTSQNVIFPAKDKMTGTFIKPPFNVSKRDKEILHAVLADLSKSSNLINFK